MMLTDVYAVGWKTVSHSKILGIYTSLEIAKKKLASIAEHSYIAYMDNNKKRFITYDAYGTDEIYYIERCVLHS